MITVVTLIDRKTKQTARTVDVVGILGNNAFPTNVTYEDGKIFACADTFDPDTGTSMNIEYEIDPVTEKVINTRDINNNGGSATGWILDSYNIGKYRILPEQVDTGTELYYLLKIIAPDETMTEVKLQDSSDSIYDIPVIMPLDETTALIPAAMSREYKFFRLDLKTNKLTKANKGDYSWIDVEQLSGSFNSPDGNVYTTTTKGISQINIENKKVEQILDFDWCGVNRNYTHRLRIVDCSDDKILLCGSYDSTNMFKSVFVQNYVSK